MGAARTKARADARAANRRPPGARAPASARARNSSQALAARRAAQQRARARRRLLFAGGGVVLMIALVATLVTVKLTQSAPHAAQPGSARMTSQVERQLASVPASTFDAVGTGTATGLRTLREQPALTSDAKPEILYVGGKFCPYCAAERWALAVALSRFGTLSGVSLIHSSPTDAYASTPTLSFAGASYTSKYLSFVPVEWFGEAPDPSTPTGYAYLQQPTAEQRTLITRYAGGAIPFVDIGNHYVLPQAQYLPSALAGLSWAQVAAATHDPSSPIARAVDGAANMLTAAICTLTHNQPGAICSAAGVRAASGSI